MHGCPRGENTNEENNRLNNEHVIGELRKHMNRLFGERYSNEILIIKKSDLLAIIPKERNDHGETESDYDVDSGYNHCIEEITENLNKLIEEAK